MNQLTIGDIAVSRVVEMEGPMMRPQDLVPAATEQAMEIHRHWLEPHFLDPNGMLIMSIQSFLVRTRHHNILIDTCIGNDKQRENPGWSNLQLPYLRDLEATGVSIEDIDIVLCTHLHIDHVGWNTRLEDGRWVPTFPNARYLFSKAEWDYWNQDKVAQMFNLPCIEDSVAPVVEAGLAEMVELDHQINDAIRLEPLVGHTAGHVGLHLTSEDHEAVLSADVMHHPVQAAEPNWAAEFLDVDPDAARETRIYFIDQYVDRDVLVLGGHFAHPSAGRLVSKGDHVQFLPIEKCETA